jgi:hypothetical protein
MWFVCVRVRNNTPFFLKKGIFRTDTDTHKTPTINLTGNIEEKPKKD